MASSRRAYDIKFSAFARAVTEILIGDEAAKSRRMAGRRHF
jgi:hypothetical protein